MFLRMFYFLVFVFSFVLSLSRALVALVLFQIRNDKLVVHILEKRIMLRFVLFMPVVTLVSLRLLAFFVIYVTNYLCDIIMSLT